MPDARTPIRAALDVAAQALEGSAAAGKWLAEPRELAAAAIAAFLHRIATEDYPYPPPEWSTVWSGQRGGGCVRAVSLEKLAAAVEKESGDA